MYEYLQPFEKHRYSYVINIANIAIINFVLVTVFLFEYNECFPFFTHPASTPGFFRSQNSRWRGGSPVIAYTAEEPRQFLPLKWDWQRWISFCLPCTNARNRCSVARVPEKMMFVALYLPVPWVMLSQQRGKEVVDWVFSLSQSHFPWSKTTFPSIFIMVSTKCVPRKYYTENSNLSC